MEDTMELKDIIPERAEFKLNDKTYAFRKITLDDRTWNERTFGKDRSFETFTNEEISKLLYHQLEDKSDFVSSEITEINDDGDLIKRKVTGPEAFRKSIVSINDQTIILGAYFKCLGFSTAMKDIELEDLKKKQEKQTGEKSLTQSQENTDILLNKSEA